MEDTFVVGEEGRIMKTSRRLSRTEAELVQCQCIGTGFRSAHVALTELSLETKQGQMMLVSDKPDHMVQPFFGPLVGLWLLT